MRRPTLIHFVSMFQKLFESVGWLGSSRHVLLTRTEQAVKAAKEAQAMVLGFSTKNWP